MTQPRDPAERIRNNDQAFLYLPVINHPISTNEIHAMAMGLSGAFLAISYQAGSEMASITIMGLLVLYAILGDPAFHALGREAPEETSIGLRTIKHEPWYFLAAFTLSAAVGFLGGPTILDLGVVGTVLVTAFLAA